MVLDAELSVNAHGSAEAPDWRDVQAEGRVKLSPQVGSLIQLAFRGQAGTAEN